MSRVAAVVQLAALAAWLGATALFVTVVAPAAFAALPTRALAGGLVARVLPPLCWAGMIAGLLVFALEATRHAGWRTGAALGAAAATLSCAVAEFVVRPRIEGLRSAIGTTLDTLPAGDPLRATFGRLHAASVGALGVGIAAAAFAAILIARRLARA